MLTKNDFQKAITDSIASYPSIAVLQQAGDPRINQHLDAMATMLAMLSSQIEVAMMEPFEKVRDSTVLADSAMRGIVRKATPARVQVRAENKSESSFLVESGRAVFDSSGRVYRIETSVAVPPGGSALFEAVQQRAVVIKHVVSGSEPFYAIDVPVSDDDSHISGVSVSDGDGEYIYRERYVNTFPGERVFHVEADDRQRVYVRFGFDGVVGVQPRDGREISLAISYSSGEVAVAFDSPFSFEYIGSPQEASIDLKMNSLILPGQNPPGMSVLRDLSRYPSVYDHNAVFLGEFDFLVRRNFPTLRFLSVWNESAEEQARGASLDNINTLFVACLSNTGAEAVLSQASDLSPVHPAVIADGNLTATQIEIKRAILAADDSYKVKFFTPVRSKINVTIKGRVSTSYVASDVKSKIEEAILAEFGETAEVSKRGRSRPLYQRVYALLRSKITALVGVGADLYVNIDDPASLLSRPEMWRFVSADSLFVTVETANIITPSWGG